jgi:hypothetical protein
MVVGGLCALSWSGGAGLVIVSLLMCRVRLGWGLLGCSWVVGPSGGLGVVVGMVMLMMGG